MTAAREYQIDPATLRQMRQALVNVQQAVKDSAKTLLIGQDVLMHFEIPTETVATAMKKVVAITMPPFLLPNTVASAVTAVDEKHKREKAALKAEVEALRRRLDIAETRREAAETDCYLLHLELYWGETIGPKDGLSDWGQLELYSPN